MGSTATTGFTDRVIAQDLDAGAPRVRRRVVRYINFGLHRLEKDALRGGRPRQLSAQRVIELTTQTQLEAATHRSTRTMFKQAGVSAATVTVTVMVMVSRIWRSHGLKPHSSKTFKVSYDI